MVLDPVKGIDILASDDQPPPADVSHDQSARWRSRWKARNMSIIERYNRGVWCVQWGTCYHTLESDIEASTMALATVLHRDTSETKSHGHSASSTSAHDSHDSDPPTLNASPMAECLTCSGWHAPGYDTRTRRNVGCTMSGQGTFDIDAALRWLEEFCGNAQMALGVLKEWIKRRWVRPAEVDTEDSDIQLFQFRRCQIRFGWHRSMGTSGQNKVSEQPASIFIPSIVNDPRASAYELVRGGTPQNSKEEAKECNCCIVNDPAPVDGYVTHLHLEVKNPAEADYWQVHVFERVLQRQVEEMGLHDWLFLPTAGDGNAFLRVASYNLVDMGSGSGSGNVNDGDRPDPQQSVLGKANAEEQKKLEWPQTVNVDVRRWNLRLKAGQFLGFGVHSAPPGAFHGFLGWAKGLSVHHSTGLGGMAQAKTKSSNSDSANVMWAAEVPDRAQTVCASCSASSGAGVLTLSDLDYLLEHRADHMSSAPSAHATAPVGAVAQTCLICGRATRGTNVRCVIVLLVTVYARFAIDAMQEC